MNIQGMIDRARKGPEARKIGMVASHLGIVRGASRDGRPVERIEVAYDRGILDNIIKDIKDMTGIIQVIVDTREGILEVGDEILAVVIAGDIREHVFDALITAVNRIKGEASRKKEYRSQGTGRTAQGTGRNPSDHEIP
jgi:molybdopterin synthase catalytic subunit